MSTIHFDNNTQTCKNEKVQKIHYRGESRWREETWMNTLWSTKYLLKWQGMIQTADLPSKYSLTAYQWSCTKTLCDWINPATSTNGRLQPWSNKPSGCTSNIKANRRRELGSLTPSKPPINPHMTQTPWTQWQTEKESDLPRLKKMNKYKYTRRATLTGKATCVNGEDTVTKDQANCQDNLPSPQETDSYNGGGNRRISREYSVTTVNNTNISLNFVTSQRKDNPHKSTLQKRRRWWRSQEACQHVPPEDGWREWKGQGLHCLHGVEEGGFSGGLNPMDWMRALYCNSVVIMHLWSMKVPMTIQMSYNMANIQSLMDSGATDNFMHPWIAQKLRLGTKCLGHLKRLFNVDNTETKSGNITHYVDLNVCTNVKAPPMGGSYMNEGMSYIRIGLPPRIVSGDRLASASCFSAYRLIVHMCMIRWSGWYRVVLVHHVCLWAPGSCFLLPTLTACMVPCPDYYICNWWRASRPASADALLLRTHLRYSSARLERLPQHWIELELRPV